MINILKLVFPGLLLAYCRLSWGVTYAIIITVVTIIITFLAWMIKLFHNSNMVYVFLLLWLYGLSIIMFSFMLTPFFHKAETAGAVGSFMTMLFSLAYLGVALTRSNHTGPEGPVSRVPVFAQWLLSLLSPVAFALGMDQVIIWTFIWIDFINLNKITNENISRKVFLLHIFLMGTANPSLFNLECCL